MLQKILALGLCAFVFGFSVPSVYAQRNIDKQIEDFSAGTTTERLETVRRLSLLVLRSFASPQERQQIIEFLRSSVDDKEAVVRSSVSVELLKIGAGTKNGDLVALAMNSANDPNINVRRRILQFYSTFFAGRTQAGQPQKEMLMEKLDDPDLETRYQVAKTLNSWGIENEKIVEIFLATIEMRNYRATATYALSQLPNHELVIKKAIERLKTTHTNAGLYIRLIAQMGDSAKPAITQLLPMFSSDQAGVRSALVDAVGNIGLDSPEGIQFVVDATKDPAPEVRQLTLPAIFQITKDLDTLSTVVGVLLKDENQFVRETAVAYACIKPEWFAKYIPKIREIFAGDSVQEKLSIITSVASAGPVAAPLVGDIEELLKSKSPDIRNAACWTLVEISADKATAAMALNRQIAKAEEDDTLIAALLTSLARAQPTDGQSKRSFLKFLSNSSPNIRYACVIGLSNFDSSDFSKTLISLPPLMGIRTSLNYDDYEKSIVDCISRQGKAAVDLANEYLSDTHPGNVRARALRILAAVDPDNDATITKINLSLDDKEPSVRFAAASSLKHQKNVSAEQIDKVLAMMNGNNRQVTVAYMNVLAGLKNNADLTVEKLAQFLSGKFRNRFSNDARRVIAALAFNVTQPVPALAESPITVQKLDCLAAIGKLNEEMEMNLRKFMNDSAKQAKTLTKANKIRTAKRNQLLAAVVLANASNDNSQINTLLLKELRSDTPEIGMLALGKLRTVDLPMIEALVSRFPETSAVDALGKLGTTASAAAPELRQLIQTSPDPMVVASAKRTLWKVEDNKEVALTTLNELLKANELQPQEIKVEHRQAVWELLQYLYKRHGEDEQVVAVLSEIRRCRFPNLRTFVENLSNNAS